MPKAQMKRLRLGPVKRSLHLEPWPSALSACLASRRMLSSVSASRSSFFLWMDSRALKALSSLNLEVSHLGDSGTKKEKAPMMRTMSKLKAMGKRHEKVLS